MTAKVNSPTLFRGEFVGGGFLDGAFGSDDLNSVAACPSLENHSVVKFSDLRNTTHLLGDTEGFQEIVRDGIA